MPLTFGQFALLIGAFWIVILALVAFGTMAYTVETGWVGVVFRFGNLVRAEKPGLRFKLPLGFEKVVDTSTQVTQQELPDEFHKIDRVNDLMAPGMSPPYRIVHRGLDEANFYIEKDPTDTTIDPTKPLTKWKLVPFADLSDEEKAIIEKDSVHAALTGEHMAVVEWYLDGNDFEAIKNYYENTSSAEGTTRIEEIRRRLNDQMPRILQEILAKFTFGNVKDNIIPFNHLLKARLRVLVGEDPDPVTNIRERPWGIKIKDAFLKPPSAGRKVNDARALAAAAVSEKEAAISDAEASKQTAILAAEADKQTRMLNADAEAYAEAQKGSGEGKRLVSMVKEITDAGIDQELAMRLATLDVLETVLPGSHPTFFSGNAADMLKVLTIPSSTKP